SCHPPPPLLPYTTLFRSSPTTIDSSRNLAVSHGFFLPCLGYTGLLQIMASMAAIRNGFITNGQPTRSRNARVVSLTPSAAVKTRSEEHTSELQSRVELVG